MASEIPFLPDVVRRRNFSTIWLAATMKGTKKEPTLREILMVNVGNTGDDIMDWMEWVSRLQPGLPLPRYSFYLSSQLQYGVVLVYHRQCAFFLDEIQQTIKRLLRSKIHISIDLPEPNRLALNVPDSLFLLEEAEGAPDPFFGVMGSGDQLPSPYRIPQPWQIIAAVTPQSSPVVSSRTASEGEEAITLKETEPVMLHFTQFEGAELTEATGRVIDLLLEQPDLFDWDAEEREGETEGTKDQKEAMTYLVWRLIPNSQSRLKDTVVVTQANEKCYLTRSRSRLKDTVVVTQANEKCYLPAEKALLAQTAHHWRVRMSRLKDTVVVGDSVWLLDKETDQPLEMPLEAPYSSEREEESEKGTERTPERAPERAPERSPERGPERTPDRAPERAPESSCGELPEVVPSRKRPGRRPKQLVFADVDTQIPREAMQLQIKDPLAETMPLVLIDPASRSTAAPRELFSAPACPHLHPDLLSLWQQCAVLRKKSSPESGQAPSETSAVSVPKEHTPASRRSPIEEEVVVAMEDIVEECVDLPEREPELTPESLLRKVSLEEDFHSLLPPDADRSTAAQMFFQLLARVTGRELGVCQRDPYGSITVIPSHSPRTA